MLPFGRFAEPMSVAEAEQYLSTTFRPLLAVHSSHGLYGRALQLAGAYSLSSYDPLIVASAIEGRFGFSAARIFNTGNALVACESKIPSCRRQPTPPLAEARKAAESEGVAFNQLITLGSRKGFLPCELKSTWRNALDASIQFNQGQYHSR